MIESRKRVRIEEEDDEFELVLLVVNFVIVVVAASYKRYKVSELAWNEYERAQKRAMWLDTIRNNTKCQEQLRFDRRCFEKLCRVLRSKGGLTTSRNVTDEEVIAFFLHILAHNLKNRTIQALFVRSGETVSRQFHVVLRAVLKIGKYYIKEDDHTPSVLSDTKWKWFEGAVGALDGTHVDMTVPLEDRGRYRNRKGHITTNVLATCDPQLRFTYVLPGWEGSASDPRVLRDALQRQQYNLKVPQNKYFLVDLGYTNGEGFLAPYKGTRYHLNLWRGNTPTNYKELFNLRHSSARNTIERAFGCMKKRWAIMRTSSFFGKKTQVRVINACAILHNFLRTEKMEETALMAEVERDLENQNVVADEVGEEDYIAAVRQTVEWNEFRDKLAKKMWQDYRARRDLFA
ncbi:uncharacterized protein LOC141649872 [Silene latifolia]|uniref:uncharacterized protein LOC141649872 n=1 Tax=Silene latifolia TaxID=37657 RepID=UPI003D78A8C8